MRVNKVHALLHTSFYRTSHFNINIHKKDASLILLGSTSSDLFKMKITLKYPEFLFPVSKPKYNVFITVLCFVVCTILTEEWGGSIMLWECFAAGETGTHHKET